MGIALFLDKNHRMSLASALLYPFMLLLPAAGSADAAVSPDEGGASSVQPVSAVWPEVEPPMEVTGYWPGVQMNEGPVGGTLLGQAFPQDARQVRVEQRMTIRISPRAAMPMPDMFFGPPGHGAPHVVERKIGKCLSAADIAGVRPGRDNRLLLLMRDRRVVSAQLDRSCRSRDFYSGFLMERSTDGRVCVDRDTLLSRSGMSCTLTRIRELVEQDD
ncbi:hypothetical protein SAMN06296065_101443 [Novosphingobium panipatense]|uniref:Uncharacterized protein n=2 Tax=Novosphingobium panipatense TaxID=428991 RepID=A0ABY1Q3G0_9SPHN|nr:hypothetical protein SAMN06296065_101443 [Novosphingobium panipatense]